MRPASFSQLRIPTLDGWRGIAILLVLVDHFFPSRDGKPVPPWLEMGQHGVSIFFVLSGFLITTLLLREQEMTGSLDLGGFYLRRVLRLMPCAWAYLLSVCAFLTLGGLAIHGDVLASALFYRNQYGVSFNSDYLTMHFWSLSIEEQFYMVWPLTIKLFKARAAAWIAGAGSILIAGFRFTHWAAYNRVPMSFHTVVRADALLLGCLAAMVCKFPEILAGLQFLRHTWPLFTLAFVYFILMYKNLIPFTECLLLAVWIAMTSCSKSWFSELLDNHWLSLLGKHAYSIYVWQQGLNQLIHRRPSMLPLVLLLIPAGAASYRFLELPFTRLGRRLTHASLAIAPKIAIP
jgi:peptidoglycan/LPS O-acetylase OafA/YrhL